MTANATEEEQRTLSLGHIRVATNFLYSIQLDSLAADRVAGHANNRTSRGKQTYSGYFGDDYIHQKAPDEKKENSCHWRQ